MESAINLKQIKVTFNKELDKTTAEDQTKYYLNASGLTSTNATAVLQDDKKSVVITLNNALTNGSAFSFKVDGVKTADGKTITSDLYNVLVNDKEAPTVSKVEYTSAGKVVITFSEPLNTSVTPILRVNGNPVAASFVSGSDTKVEATVSLTKGSTATVYLAGAKDLAGNEMDLFNGTVTAPNDNTAPKVVSVTQVANDTLRLVFDEELGSGAYDLASNEVKILKGSTLYTNGNPTGTTISVTKNTTVDPTGKTYDVKIDLDAATGSDGIYANGATSQALTLLIDANAFGDAYGNTNTEAFTQNVTMNKDTAGPVLVSGKVSSDKTKFELTFNEDIVFPSGADSNIVVTDANGVRYTVATGSGETSVSGTDSKTLLLDIVSGTGTIANGTYTIKLNPGAVTDVGGNNNATVTTSITVGDAADTTKPTANITNAGGAKNKFLVTFSEEVTPATALNAANYTLDGKALPAGTDIYFTNSNKNAVEIDLPANSINFGSVSSDADAVLEVKGVADKAGNVVDTTRATVKVADNTPAVLESAQLVGDVLVLDFNENIALPSGYTDIDDVLGDFVIKGGTTTFDKTTTVPSGTDAIATVSANNDKLYITITGNDSNWSTVKAASTITVTTDTPALTDSNGLPVKDKVTVTVTKN